MQEWLDLPLVKAARDAVKNYTIVSFAFAFCVSLLRIARDNSERRCARRLQEATICGCITLSLSLGAQAVLTYIDVPPEKLSATMYCASIFIAGAVGNLGSDFVRSTARKMANKKLRGD